MEGAPEIPPLEQLRAIKNGLRDFCAYTLNDQNAERLITSKVTYIERTVVIPDYELHLKMEGIPGEGKITIRIFADGGEELFLIDIAKNDKMRILTASNQLISAVFEGPTPSIATDIESTDDISTQLQGVLIAANIWRRKDQKEKISAAQDRLLKHISRGVKHGTLRNVAQA